MADQNVIAQLATMGFPKEKCVRAMVATHHVGFEAALNWLLSGDPLDDDVVMVDELSTPPPQHAEDADLLLALKLQKEEEELREKNTKVRCQLTGKEVPLDKIYIMDDCTCKFDRDSLIEYLAQAIRTQVNIKCPKKGCDKPLAVGDIKALMPDVKTKAAASQGNSGGGFFGGLIPSSSSKQATQRISSELTHILKTDPTKQGYSVEPVGDNLYLWELKFFSFDPKDEIAKDLKKMNKDHIMLHITFPPTYPLHPPFVRVIRPRFVFRTGHVTIGGSICTELLTNKGWSPANTIEAVIVSVRAQFMEGGARLDMSNKTDYTEAEAKEAFNRMVQTHGWQ